MSVVSGKAGLKEVEGGRGEADCVDVARCPAEAVAPWADLSAGEVSSAVMDLQHHVAVAHARAFTGLHARSI